MATPPPEASVLENKSQAPPVENVPSDANLGSGDSVLDAKNVTVKEPENGVEPQVNQEAVNANQSLTPVVNGNGTTPPSSNGVKTMEVVERMHKSPSTRAEDAPVNESTPNAEQPPADPTVTSSEEKTEVPTPKEGSDSATKKENADNVSSAAPAIEEPQTQSSPHEFASEQENKKLSSAETKTPDVPQSSASHDEKSQQAQEKVSADDTNAQNKPSRPEQSGEHSSEAAAGDVASQVQPSETGAAPEAKVQSQGDVEMADASQPSSAKVSRDREEDATEEPAAKRAKTEDTTPAEAPEFKVPDVPSTGAPAPSVDAVDFTSAMTRLQNKFLIRALQSIKRVRDARFFREPVDTVKLNIPNYPLVIKQPMDLRTMEEQLKTGHYTTVGGLVADFDLMVSNSSTFNGPDHVVTIEGRRLRENFDKHLSKLPKPDEVELTPAEKKAKKSTAAPTKTQPARRESRGGGNTTSRPTNATSPTTTFALNPEGLPLIRRDSATVDGRPKRSIHPPKNRDLPYSAKPKKKKFQWELKFCQEVLDELHKPRHFSFAAPFYQPVDPVALNIPNYHSIIKKPMDLQTVQTKLSTGQYENAKEMETDMRQIFKNCFKFNIPGDPTYMAGKRLEELYDSKWSQKSRWLEAHEPSSGHQSGGSSDNGSDDNEDEDSEVDIEQERLTMLQKQIAEMSKQVDAITQKKKKTPPTSSKKSSKAKSGKKDTTKKSSTSGAASSGKKDKKGGSKPAKSEKTRWVTYREKQMISNGISSLPDKRMSEALKIIQSNVPSVKGTHETEIELDIDELPNDVLMMLLKFVKKHAPHALEVDEPEPEPMPNVAPSKPKKNKPMSKYEQEAQINRLEGSLSRFQAGHSPDPMPSVEMPAESSEDDDSEESEEE